MRHGEHREEAMGQKNEQLSLTLNSEIRFSPCAPCLRGSIPASNLEPVVFSLSAPSFPHFHTL